MKNSFRDTCVTLVLTALGVALVPYFASTSFAHASAPLPPDQIMCTMQYDPVCGAQPVQCVRAPCYPQYKTYGNACMAGAEGATIIHQGECLSNESGPYISPTSTPAEDQSTPPPPAPKPWWYWLLPWNWGWWR
jgi:hypothetical protein